MIPGWFLLRGGLPVLLDLNSVRLCPVFPSADLSRQFAEFAGLPADCYPALPDEGEYRGFQPYTRRKGCAGLVVIVGVHPWQAVAVSGGRHTPVACPEAVALS